MASELLCLGFLFTITLTCIYSQVGANESEIVLIPQPHRIIVLEQKAPLLINCSVNITELRHQTNFLWRKDGDIIDINKGNKRKSKVREADKKKFKALDRANSALTIFANGSLYFPNGVLSLHGSKKDMKNKKLDGVYECVVNTTKGIALVRRVKVVSASISQSFQTQPAPREAYRGGVARFECNISSEPSTTYIWHKDNKEAHDSRFTILPSGILQISDVQQSDEGTYWCQATPQPYTVQDNAGYTWKQSKKAELKVKSSIPNRLEILAAPRNISVVVGDTAFFECLADGNPIPEITWLKINKDSADKISSDKIYGPGNLRIPDVQPGDAGLYECTITTFSGKQFKKFAILNVLEPPKIDQDPVSFAHPVSKTHIISCHVSGNPTPNITWYHNGTNIDRNPSLFPKDNSIKNPSLLTLYSLQLGHSGYYVCVAENSVGQAMSVAFGGVFRGANPANQPVNVKIFAINSTAINVTWEQPDLVQPYKYVLSYQVADATTPPEQSLHSGALSRYQFFEIGGLLPFTNYSVTIMAFITGGASLPTPREYVKTLEDVPIAVPKITLQNPKHYSILVSWTPLTVAQSRGIVTGYKVYYRLADSEGEQSRDVPAEHSSYLLNGLEPEATYEFLVLAATKAGFPNVHKQKWVSFTMPPIDASSPPILNVNYVNMSAVQIDWHDPKPKSVTGYILELYNQSAMVDRVILPSTSHYYLLIGLDSKKQYEVRLFAQTSANMTSNGTIEFTVEKLAEELVIKNLRAFNITANSLALEWSSLTRTSMGYEVCYSFEADTFNKSSCQHSDENVVVISNLEPYKRYEFKVRPFIVDGSGNFSHLIVQTKEGKSSPPVNVTIELAKAGTVKLSWFPPNQPHGAIVSYVILYTNETNSENRKWKSITKETIQEDYFTAQVEDLEPGRYYFKLAAINSAGDGLPSGNHIIEIDCYSAIMCRNNDQTDESPKKMKTESKDNIVLIVGIVAGLFILAVMVFIIAYCYKRRSSLRETDTNINHPPVYRGNGHITTMPTQSGHHKPGNGHVHLTNVGDFTNDMLHSPESTPMLQQLPENEQSDSKGAPDIIMPNGLRSNGIIKSYHKIPGNTVISHQGDLNSGNNLEELQFLMAAVLKSFDGSDAMVNSVEMMPISTLDDINHRDEPGDHSSEDSGTGCRRAGMLCKDLNHHGSLASSPGGTSLLEQRTWDNGRLGDEFGGVFIDSSTGAAIKLIGDEQCKAAEGGNYDDILANDRDSGHGSEVKAFVVFLKETNKSGSHVSEADGVASCDLKGVGQNDSQQFSPSPTQSPSSQQLPYLSSRNLSSRPPNSHRHHHRDVHHHISHLDLPPPPPPPTLPTYEGLQAAVTAATIAAPAELNSSGSKEEGGQRQHLSKDAGSNRSKPFEGKTELTFFPPRPPPSPPHIV